jgi:hypothetical protein
VSGWHDHSPEFVDVREYDDGRPIVVMDLVPPDADVMHEAWDALTRLWLDLPPHANIIDAIARSGLGLLVRFAALDWRHEPLVLGGDRRSNRQAAIWGLQLCDAMSLLVEEVGEDERGWFTCPMTKIDIDGQVRLAFLRVAPRHPRIGRFVAPEVQRAWPRCGEPGLVYLIGVALDELTDSFMEQPSPLAPIIDRCRAGSLDTRFGTIGELRAALRTAGRVSGKQRQRRDADDWRAFEEALSWKSIIKPITRHMAWADRPREPGPRAAPPLPGSARAYLADGKTFFRAGRLAEARACFERALALDPMMIEAMHLRREVDRCAARAREEAGHAWPVNHDIDDALARSAHLEAMLRRLDGDGGDGDGGGDGGKNG